nr:transposase [Streptomyces sp. NRRL F-2305]
MTPPTSRTWARRGHTPVIRVRGRSRHRFSIAALACYKQLDARLRAFIDTRDWITAYQLPPYAPDLNPVEGIWSLVRRAGQNNTAFTDPDHLMHVLRRTLRELQYRSETIDGCLAATGLTLTTSRRQAQ